MSPTPCHLAQNIHGHRQKSHSRRDTPNNEEAIPNTLGCNPVVAVECQSEGEEVLDKVHDREGLGCLLTVAVDYVRDDAGRAELDAQVDETEADNDGDGPRVLGVERLAPGEKADGCKEQVGGHDGQAKLGFWWDS